MIDKTLRYVLGKDIKFRSLGAGRTDAKVSAESTYFQLFIAQKIQDESAFLEAFNFNLPQDIRAFHIREVATDFNIIQHSKEKEYRYLFTQGQKNHPFCAPLMTTFLEPLDVDKMMDAAPLFEGTHNFRAYCYQAKENGLFHRHIQHCSISKNDWLSANFFPENSYMLRVVGQGFGRNQIRLMMGALVKVGRNEFTADDIKASLKTDSTVVMDYIAPASGLILTSVKID